MDPVKGSIFASLANRMRFLSARTSVIAENIANADTPGYGARDVAAPDFSARVTKMRVADPRHLQASGTIGGTAGGKEHMRVVAAPDAEASLNGNRVSVETQMMKLSETRMDYQLATSVYRKGLDMIRLAVRGSR